MKYFIIIALIINVSFCAEVQIVADRFSASETTKKATFFKNVLVAKGKDRLKSDKLVVSFDKKRKPIRYEASGNSSILVFIKQKEYHAKGDSLIYEPKISQYTIKGNAILMDKTTNKEVIGEVIKINQDSGKYEVTGKKNEPVKFIFQIDDSKVGSKFKN